ncbi:MAG: Na/Pi symporter [Ignavibacteriae bacterium]|nr:hypothetical protein [Ignavibacteriota bacterium]NOG97227.1 Na/Pi symporter [Ignavibacteriota bacterium]
MNSIQNYLKEHPNIIAVIKLIFFLYLFLFSLQLMGDALKLFGKDFSETLISTTSNPFVGLFIGILATSIVQSSSSTTSIVVGLVAGGAIGIDSAIPIVMGANIGTSITNILASLPQINRSNEFRKAFAAAVVHDFFNFLSVLLLFPIQLATNFLGILASKMTNVFEGIGGLSFLSPVKALTKPVSEFMVEKSLTILPNEDFAGWVLLIIAIIFLFLALKYMVSALKVLVVSKAKDWFNKYLFKNPLRAFVVGIILTVMVQSSSITTSLMVPLAGAGLLTLRQVFPYTIGANLGTTITAILAALITNQPAAVVVAFSHLLFNLCGTLVWWPLGSVPITMAEKFAEYSTRSKFIPVAFVLTIFFIIPILVILISN